MKFLTFIFSAFAILVLSPSISKAIDNNRPQLIVETEKREVSNFHGIASGGSFNIVVKMGDQESLEIEGDKDDIDRIETVVQNGTLKIRMKRDLKNFNIPFNSQVNIYITAKKLDALAVSGSGNLEVEGELNSASANIQLSGSGSVKAKVETQSVSVILSGSGGLNLSGTTGSSTITISGSGDLNAVDLKSKTSNIKIAGNATATLYVEDYLNASLVGPCSVKYKGGAEVKLTNLVGSGSVTKM
ncbi:head GIN domain-containing protein [Pedobacter cryophilus]|uniref:DUF2807 domain-containing protein n=1 Tax=Pedobacter cryophilus TaxID=2571271 RepID=A0A4U1BXM7_9SPHI|nr:head GIN domain-containing protein [Pedobacter cryophilus]TKB96286.1 DUF2807 domain-containing protein [Pedobacter cryophilus]